RRDAVRAVAHWRSAGDGAVRVADAAAVDHAPRQHRAAPQRHRGQDRRLLGRVTSQTSDGGDRAPFISSGARFLEIDPFTPLASALCSPCWVEPTFSFRSQATTGRTLMIKRHNKRTPAAAPRRRRFPSPRSRQTRNKPASPLRSPSVVVVMGVSGCGKSTIASMLAHRLNWIFEEGDWFHPPSNVEKMHNGVPPP